MKKRKKRIISMAVGADNGADGSAGVRNAGQSG